MTTLERPPRESTTANYPVRVIPFNYKKPVQVLSDRAAQGTDEGRAMLEIVHDIAPGAELAFHTADFGSGRLCEWHSAIGEQWLQRHRR